MNEDKLDQILRNQSSIMFWISKGDLAKGYFRGGMEETEELLSPKKEERPDKNKEAHDALSEGNEK